jgi:hypothetical protein
VMNIQSTGNMKMTSAARSTIRMTAVPTGRSHFAEYEATSPRWESEGCP